MKGLKGQYHQFMLGLEDPDITEKTLHFVADVLLAVQVYLD